MSMFRSIYNKAKKKLHLHQSGALKECKPGKHISQENIGNCADPTCQKDICENCQVQAPNENIYCMQCYATKPELRQDLQAIQDDEDDDDDGEMFAFDSSRNSNRGTFTKVGVTMDKTTGEFKGIDQFYAMVENSGGAASGHDSIRSAANDLTKSRKDAV